MKKRTIFLILALLALTAIGKLIFSLLGFNEDYFERSSGIELPSSYTVISAYDNMEFVSIAVIEMDKEDCREFASKNNFKSPDSQYYPPIFQGMQFLDSNLRTLPDEHHVMIKNKPKSPGEVGWIYLIDTVRCRLYCEIEYPDMGGN